MRKVVSNTTPIINLLKIEKLELLRELSWINDNLYKKALSIAGEL